MHGTHPLDNGLVLLTLFVLELLAFFCIAEIWTNLGFGMGLRFFWTLVLVVPIFGLAIYGIVTRGTPKFRNPAGGYVAGASGAGTGTPSTGFGDSGCGHDGGGGGCHDGGGSH